MIGTALGRRTTSGAGRLPFPSGPTAGHHLVAHPGGCEIEAWGQDAASCITEALSGLVESFARAGDPPVTSTRPIGTEPCAPEDALVALLEEVVYTLDVWGEIPVRFHLAPTEDGGFGGDMEVVPARRVELVGPVPTGVSYHGLEMGRRGEGWRCRVLIER